jgi:hypothetical protein
VPMDGADDTDGADGAADNVADNADEVKV